MESGTREGQGARVKKLNEYESPVGIKISIYETKGEFTHPFTIVCEDHGEIEFANDHETAIKIWSGRRFCDMCRALEARTEEERWKRDPGANGDPL